MKVTVIEIYQDKITGEHHQIGEVLDIKDSKRADELVEAGVVKMMESSKPSKKTTTKE